MPASICPTLVSDKSSEKVRWGQSVFPIICATRNRRTDKAMQRLCALAVLNCAVATPKWLLPHNPNYGVMYGRDVKSPKRGCLEALHWGPRTWIISPGGQGKHLFGAGRGPGTPLAGCVGPCGGVPSGPAAWPRRKRSVPEECPEAVGSAVGSAVGLARKLSARLH